MAENKEHIGGSDRSRVPGSQDNEVRHFAEAIGLDVEKVRRLIERHGADGVTPGREPGEPKGH